MNNILSQQELLSIENMVSLKAILNVLMAKGLISQAEIDAEVEKITQEMMAQIKNNIQQANNSDIV